MAKKHPRVSRGMLFTWFMLAGLIFLFAPQSLTNKFHLAFTHIFRWPLSIGRNISLAARIQQPSNAPANNKEAQYQNYITNLEAQLKQERQKVEELSGLRNRTPLQGTKLMLADVITSSIDQLHSELTINRGGDDGLAKGQFVLADNSIIGIISDTSSRTARVKLLTDPASKIAIKIGKLNVERIMQGSGNNSARIQLVPIEHKVKTGDIIYTSKKTGSLDAPMIIGKVAQCKRDDQNPSLWDITVKPACDIERLTSVAVIINPPDAKRINPQ
jgi:rod shape-determining protein MreC